MTDTATLDTWSPKFEEWRAKAIPLFQKGETNEPFDFYPWFQSEGDPFAKLGKAASKTRFGLVTTGGYSIEGEQEPVKPLPNLGGTDPEVREIPLDVDRSKLVIHHPGYDHRFAEEDINVNLPFDRLQELAESGEIGSIAETTHVLMGLVVDVAPLIRTTIPELVEKLRSDDVEAVLLVPS